MSFNDLKNHHAIADPLRHSLERGRLAHAYLFTGVRGAGKEDVARTLAQALNCLEKENDACGKCDSCRRIATGNHPDIHWVRPESKSRRITVDQLREFERAVNLRAANARVKIGIIADAECLNEEASNAFLKTLEEPPAQTIIILLTAEPQRLLPTILSRCLRIGFGPVANSVSPYRAQVLPVLAKFAEARGVAGAYQLLAALTGLLQQLKEQTKQTAEAEADLDRYDHVDAKLRGRMEEQLEARIAGEYRSAREQVLEELYSWFADVLLCVEKADTELLEHPEQIDALRRAAANLTPARAGTNLDAIEEIRESLFRNIPETLAFEVALLKVAAV